MTDATLRALISRLSDLTHRGKVSWEETPKKDTFQLPFRNFTVQLSVVPSKTDRDEMDYRIRIMNQEGSVVEQATDVELEQNSDKPKHYYLRLMANLYEGARRNAMGADQAVRELLSELDEADDDAPPF